MLDCECMTDLELWQREEAMPWANDQDDHVFESRNDAQPERIDIRPRGESSS